MQHTENVDRPSSRLASPSGWSVIAPVAWPPLTRAQGEPYGVRSIHDGSPW